eukprot:TRINITY_DN7716_c0_g2_i1.p1 TRINITY_DN7716_c0_g2~~TRINITY_DN7716_c0_g2_i1.p1  ORF type:complete len:388 (+),score=70.93 TRINITY_DN7716_c0_g2_i1:152-1165(+)
MTKLTFNPEYAQERDHQFQENPTSIHEGLRSGAHEFGRGIVGTVTGVVKDPLMGAKKNKTAGFIKGLGKAAIAIPVKPSVGLLDTVHKLAQGLQNEVDDWKRAERRRKRLPRYFGIDKGLKEWDYQAAVGQSMLYSLRAGRYMKEWYMFHHFLENDLILLASDKHFFLVQQTKRLDVVWSVRLAQLAPDRIEILDGQGIAIHSAPRGNGMTAALSDLKRISTQVKASLKDGVDGGKDLIASPMKRRISMAALSGVNGAAGAAQIRGPKRKTLTYRTKLGSTSDFSKTLTGDDKTVNVFIIPIEKKKMRLMVAEQLKRMALNDAVQQKKKWTELYGYD